MQIPRYRMFHDISPVILHIGGKVIFLIKKPLTLVNDLAILWGLMEQR